MKRTLLFLLLAVMCEPAISASSSAAAGAIELVNPYPAVGPLELSGSLPANRVLRAMQQHSAPPVTDVIAQSLQGVLVLKLDAQVQVVRRPRYSGMEALRRLRLSAPDGRTLLLGGTDTVVIRPSITHLRYDVLHDVRPIALLAHISIVLVTAGRGSSVERLLQSRNAFRRVHIGSPGELTTAHLAAVQLKRITGVSLEPVAFNGTHDLMRAVISGHVDAAWAPLPGVLPYARNGRVRALAIADSERAPALPHVPTMGEAGVPGAEASGWYGLFAPAATPAYVIERIGTALLNEWTSPEIVERMAQHGLQARHVSHGPFTQIIQADYRRWAPYIEESRAR